ncbi:MAG: toll/interleukin-1 receptor domain-containing protein [Planctomycetota bacterium]|jgi:hypothetical protein
MSVPKKQIFISHISEEKKLALLLKKFIERRFSGQLSVFVSSESITPGDKWRENITSALDQSKLLIILYSPLSKTRPWIHFEAGCGWIKNIPIIPICHSKLRLEEIGEPISSFQAIEIEDKDFVENLFEAIIKHTGVLDFFPPRHLQSKEALIYYANITKALSAFYSTDNIQ